MQSTRTSLTSESSGIGRQPALRGTVAAGPAASSAEERIFGIDDGAAIVQLAGPTSFSTLVTISPRGRSAQYLHRYVQLSDPNTPIPGQTSDGDAQTNENGSLWL